jgi:rhamnulose-1-phosphate aldolase/alcohol dehydrogenase
MSKPSSPSPSPVSLYSGKGDALAELVTWSRHLGADSNLVLRGGGNTSVKVRERDVAGRPCAVLRVKGSGSDLASAAERDFAGVRLDDVLPLFAREAMSDEEMVGYLARTLTDPAAPRPSIETLLHAFIPAASVFHSHADVIVALTNNANPEAALTQALGAGVLRIRYRRPGFRLSREVGEAVRATPDAEGLVLLNHGLVTWGDTPEEAYRRHLLLVQRAEAWFADRGIAPGFPRKEESEAQARRRRARAAALAPVLRGALGAERRMILTWCDGPEVMAFVDSPEARAASAAGAVTPDHILTTGVLPLWLDLPRSGEPAALRAAIDAALAGHRAAYARYHAEWNEGEPALEGMPRVVLVPGVGMFSAGRDPRSAALARDIYLHTIGIIARAEQLGGYRSLDERDQFQAEYWPLELYKLSIAPPERELARRVALVTGATGALGRAIAWSLARAGALVVVTDRELSAAQTLAEEIEASVGPGSTLALRLDVTREAHAARALADAALAFGGVDVVVSNAGSAHCAPLEALRLEDWEASLAVNATGHFLVTRAALRHFRAQGTGGAMVFIATKNVTAPGKDFGAYSAAKAAEAQLARVAAIEGGPLGVRVNMVNPDAIFAGSGLWDGIRESRAASRGVAPHELEAVYRARTLLGTEVRAGDVAEAVLFLASDRSSRTTGAMLPVDGGVREAFPR